jgi:hypothetical protein
VKYTIIIIIIISMEERESDMVESETANNQMANHSEKRE